MHAAPESLEVVVRDAEAGTIGIMGVFPPQKTSAPTGAVMHEDLTVKPGTCNYRRCIPQLLDLVRTGAVDLGGMLTHVEELPSVLDGYATFEQRGSSWTKVALLPGD